MSAPHRRGSNISARGRAQHRPGFRLERKYAKETEVIRRDDRLDTIAKDIVDHFPGRGYLRKGMVITLDKFTAVTMYDKVQHHWKEAMRDLRGRIGRPHQRPKSGD